MPRQIDLSYFAAYFDACAAVTINESYAAPKITITLAVKRKRALEAIANALKLGTFRQVPVDRGYMYEWAISDYDEIELLLLKLRNYVVVSHDLVETMLTYYSCQRRLDAIVARGGEFTSNRYDNAIAARREAITDLIRTVRDFA